MPERAVVSRPDTPLEIPKGEAADFFCGIPLRIEVRVGDVDNSIPLATVATRELSKTWFGTPQVGEAAFASKTGAVLDHRQLRPRGFRAVCPVSIRNDTRETLLVERICLRVIHLSLFEGAEYLWTNVVRITKSSVSDPSRVVYGTGAPEQETTAVRVAEPEERPPATGVIHRTFTNLRQFISELA